MHIDYCTSISGEFSNAVPGVARGLCKLLYSTWNAFQILQRISVHQSLTFRRQTRILDLDGTGVGSGPLAVEIAAVENWLVCSVPGGSLQPTAIMVAALLRRATFNIAASMCYYPVPSNMQRWHTAGDSLPTGPCSPQRIGHFPRHRVQGVFRIHLLVNREHILNLRVDTGSGPPLSRYFNTSVTVPAILPVPLSTTDDLRHWQGWAFYVPATIPVVVGDGGLLWFCVHRCQCIQTHADIGDQRKNPARRLSWRYGTSSSKHHLRSDPFTTMLLIRLFLSRRSDSATRSNTFGGNL